MYYNEDLNTIFLVKGAKPLISYKINSEGEMEKYFNFIYRMGSIIESKSAREAEPVSSAEYNAFNAECQINLDANTQSKSRLSWLGIEKDNESGYGMHGVRQYDNEIGRFLSVDPLWEKYISWSPYHYCMNNPVSAVDMNGKKVFENRYGTVLYNDNDENTADERYYVSDEMIYIATDADGNIQWNLLANASNRLRQNEVWNDRKNDAAFFYIGEYEFMETTDGRLYKFYKPSEQIIDNSQEFAATISLVGGLFKAGISKLFNLNRGNWFRIGRQRHGAQKVFRAAWGAHEKYLPQVPKHLQEFNKWLRKINGGHWDIWKYK